MQNGFNYFDTAFKYCEGKNEPALRKALINRYPRESYILTTKLSNEFMHSKEEQGLIKHIGMSFHDSAELLDEILTAHPELDVVQLQINYLDWENESIQSRKCYEVARKHHKPVLVMEPVKRGTLAMVPDNVEALFKEKHPDWSPASWAIRFAASHEGVLAVLSGMNTMEQLQDNMAALKDFTSLTLEELDITKKAAELLHQQITVPCTGCRYWAVYYYCDLRCY